MAMDSLQEMAYSKFTPMSQALFNRKNDKDGSATIGEVYDTNPYKPLNPKASADTAYVAEAGGTVEEVYNANSYRSGSDVVKELNYEAVYSNADYAGVLSQQRQADQAAEASTSTILAELSSGNAASIKAVLDSAYGDVDMSTPATKAAQVGRYQTPAEAAVSLATLYGESDATIAAQLVQSGQYETLAEATTAVRAARVGHYQTPSDTAVGLVSLYGPGQQNCLLWPPRPPLPCTELTLLTWRARQPLQ